MDKNYQQNELIDQDLTCIQSTGPQIITNIDKEEKLKESNVGSETNFNEKLNETDIHNDLIEVTTSTKMHCENNDVIETLDENKVINIDVANESILNNKCEVKNGAAEPTEININNTTNSNAGAENCNQSTITRAQNEETLQKLIEKYTTDVEPINNACGQNDFNNSKEIEHRNVKQMLEMLGNTKPKLSGEFCGFVDLEEIVKPTELDKFKEMYTKHVGRKEIKKDKVCVE